MFGQNNQDDQQQNDFSNFGQPAANDMSFGASAPAPGAPAGPLDDHTAPTVEPTTAPAADLSTPEIPEHATTNAAPADTDGLLDIKQDALQQLSPLVGHLEQSPEEKFRTTMMMIQASDDHTLIKEAYDAAKQITDEKARAQALLDVVNEINYFTQQQQN